MKLFTCWEAKIPVLKTFDSVSITARAKRFPLKKGKSIAEKKKKISVNTVHQFHGNTLAYMQGDVNWSTRKKTATGKNYQQPIFQGQFYTLLSCGKSLDKFLLLNSELWWY